MDWIAFTLLAVFLWSVNSILAKYVLKNYIKQPMMMLSLFPFFNLFFAFLVWVFQPVVIPSTEILFLSLFSGFLYFLAMFFFMKSLSVEEVSRVRALFSSHSILVLLLSSFFISEIFTPEKYLGIFLIVFGSIFISIKKGTKIELSKALGFMLLAIIFEAFHLVSQKVVLNNLNYWSTFFWVRIGTLFSIPILFTQFNSFIKIVKKTPLTAIYLSLREILSGSGVYLSVIAYSLGPVSLVSALIQVEPLVVLFMVTIISIFKPKILKEELKGSILLLKIISIAMIVSGAILIKL
jgi:drug/metabolite transporter (DMT)-like permease